MFEYIHLFIWCLETTKHFSPLLLDKVRLFVSRPLRTFKSCGALPDHLNLQSPELPHVYTQTYYIFYIVLCILDNLTPFYDYSPNPTVTLQHNLCLKVLTLAANFMLARNSSLFFLNNSSIFGTKPEGAL